MQMLALAAQAPSGHNTQPWTIRRIDALQWSLGIEASRRLPAVDAKARETVLSLGAFLENLLIAGRHFGYLIDYQALQVPTTDGDVIDLRLSKVSAEPQQVAQILQRRTLRNGHLRRELSSKDVSTTIQGGGNFQYFPSGSTGAQYLSAGTLEANRQQAWREDAQKELADWIRWSAEDAERYRNGLTPAAMEMGGLTGWYVRHFYTRSSVLTKSFRETTIAQVARRVSEGAGWIVLSDSKGDVPALIETGRHMQRMWLKIRDRDIAIHPMTQMLEEQPWREQVASSIGLGGLPQFLLRVGYVDSYPPPASLRMPPEWFVR